MTVEETRIRKAQYYQDNRVQIQAKRKLYRANNQEKVKLQDYTKDLKWRRKNANYYRDWQRANPESVKKSKETFKRLHPGKQAEYDHKHAPSAVVRCRTRRHTDPMYALKLRVRRRLRSVLKVCGATKHYKTSEVIGCSWDEAVEHLQNNDRGFKFMDKDMHVDHIRPMNAFENLECPIQQRLANHYLNLQLLPAKENLQKQAKFDYESWAASDVGLKLLALEREWREAATHVAHVCVSI
jgi:hypothetical protein